MCALAMTGDNKWSALAVVIKKVLKCYFYILVNKAINLGSHLIGAKITIYRCLPIMRSIDAAASIIGAGLVCHHPLSVLLGNRLLF